MLYIILYIYYFIYIIFMAINSLIAAGLYIVVFSVLQNYNNYVNLFILYNYIYKLKLYLLHTTSEKLFF